MFLAKRARPDILIGVVFLSIRVLKPNTDDWVILLRILDYLNLKRNIMLKLEAEDITTFGTHTDFKSHTGATFSLGKGSAWSESTKQKVDTQSSTEAEVTAIHDKISKIIWMKRFFEYKGLGVKMNILFQDNTSTIKMGNNGKNSTGRRTRHFDIKYFLLQI